MMILVSCQNDRCAEETSFPLDMVRMFAGEPICENCYIEGSYDPKGCEWTDLSEVTFKDLDPNGQQIPDAFKAMLLLSMIQDLARNMMETGGAEPYDFEAHKRACSAMTKALAAIAKQEDVICKGG